MIGIGGAITKRLWDDDVVAKGGRWKPTLDMYKRVDHFTVQPRDFNLDQEVEHDIKFFNLVREKSPDFQPWLYMRMG